MKIITNAAGVVLYAGHDLALNAEMAFANGSEDRRLNTANAHLHEVPDVPRPWAGGCWRYADGVFQPIADALARLVASDGERITAGYVGAVQAHLDVRARERGFDGILSAASYATSTHVRFGPEGAAYRDWRDAVWSHCYQALADVQAGLRPVPAEAELIAELPALVLP